MIKFIKNKIGKSDSSLIELLRHSFSSLILKILSIGVGYIFTYIVVRFYGSAIWGIFSLSFAVMQIASIPGRLGLDTALLKLTSEYQSQKKYLALKSIYYKSNVIVSAASLLMTVVLFFSSQLIAENVFHKVYLKSSIELTAIAILPLNLLFINAETMRGFLKIKEYSFYKTVALFVFAIPLLFVLPYFFNNLIAEGSFVLGLFVAAILSCVSLLYIYPSTTEKIANSISIKQIMNIAWPMLLSSSLVFILEWSATIIIGIYRPPSEVGIYNVALKLSGITSLTLMAINSIAAPKFAEYSGKSDFKSLETVISHSTKLIFWASIPVLLIYIIFPTPILGLFGNEFKQAATALTIISIGQFINGISGSGGNLLQMTGHQNQAQILVLIGAIINISLNLLLVPNMGIIGSAIASLAATATWKILAVIIIKKKFGIMTMYIPFIFPIKTNKH